MRRLSWGECCRHKVCFCHPSPYPYRRGEHVKNFREIIRIIDLRPVEFLSGMYQGKTMPQNLSLEESLAQAPWVRGPNLEDCTENELCVSPRGELVWAISDPSERTVQWNK